MLNFPLVDRQTNYMLPVQKDDGQMSVDPEYEHLVDKFVKCRIDTLDKNTFEQNHTIMLGIIEELVREKILENLGIDHEMAKNIYRGAKERLISTGR